MSMKPAPSGSFIHPFSTLSASMVSPVTLVPARLESVLGCLRTATRGLCTTLNCGRRRGGNSESSAIDRAVAHKIPKTEPSHTSRARVRSSLSQQFLIFTRARASRPARKSDVNCKLAAHVSRLLGARCRAAGRRPHLVPAVPWYRYIESCSERIVVDGGNTESVCGAAAPMAALGCGRGPWQGVAPKVQIHSVMMQTAHARSAIALRTAHVRIANVSQTAHARAARADQSLVACQLGQAAASAGPSASSAASERTRLRRSRQRERSCKRAEVLQEERVTRMRSGRGGEERF
jgi:hypothetical protein